MKLTDLSNETPSVKRAERIKQNDELARKLEREGVDYFRQRVQAYLNDDSIPPYEVGVVVGSKHANYHETGFHGGQNGRDDPNLDSMDIEAAFSFLSE